MDKVRVSRVCATSITVLSAVGALSATAGADTGQGGVVSYDAAANRLLFVGTEERNHLRLTKAGDRVKVADAAPGQRPVPGQGCGYDPADSGAVLCGFVSRGAPLVVTLDLLGGADDVEFGFKVHGKVYGGDGDDFVHRYDNGTPFTSSVSFFGGPGLDGFEYQETATAGVRVSVNGVADDGAAGDADNVRQDVEWIGGTAGGDVITGDGSDETIDARGGDDEVYGNGGRDAIDSGFGHDLVHAGDGDDTVTGKGTGALHGDEGNDTLRSVVGSHSLSGSSGRDTFFADDANPGIPDDTIFCGSDVDSVDADTRAHDSVAADCESVS